MLCSVLCHLSEDCLPERQSNGRHRGAWADQDTFNGGSHSSCLACEIAQVYWETRRERLVLSRFNWQSGEQNLDSLKAKLTQSLWTQSAKLHWKPHQSVALRCSLLPLRSTGNIMKITFPLFWYVCFGAWTLWATWLTGRGKWKSQMASVCWKDWDMKAAKAQ